MTVWSNPENRKDCSGGWKGSSGASLLPGTRDLTYRQERTPPALLSCQHLPLAKPNQKPEERNLVRSEGFVGLRLGTQSGKEKGGRCGERVAQPPARAPLPRPFSSLLSSRPGANSSHCSGTTGEPVCCSHCLGSCQLPAPRVSPSRPGSLSELLNNNLSFFFFSP